MEEINRQLAVVEKNERNSLILAMKEYKGKTFLDIREYYFKDEENGIATKRGVTVTNPGTFMDLLQALNANKDEILDFLATPRKETTPRCSLKRSKQSLNNE